MDNISTHKKKTLRRITNALAVKAKGCLSASCPLRTYDPDSPVTGNLCKCKTELREIIRQLDKELQSIGV